MKGDLLNGQLGKILGILGRYSLVLFMIIVTTGLVASIYILTGIINMPYSDNSSSQSSSNAFDQTTINSLSKFETSSKNVEYKTLPSDRFNPFNE